jgi:hypothetical protein
VAALLLVAVGLGLFGAARFGLLPARLLAIAGLGGTTGPAKADPAAQPPKETSPVKPAAAREKGDAGPEASAPAPKAAP